MSTQAQAPNKRLKWIGVFTVIGLIVVDLAMFIAVSISHTHTDITHMHGKHITHLPTYAPCFTPSHVPTGTHGSVLDLATFIAIGVAHLVLCMHTRPSSVRALVEKKEMHSCFVCSLVSKNGCQLCVWCVCVQFWSMVEKQKSQVQDLRQSSRAVNRVMQVAISTRYV